VPTPRIPAHDGHTGVALQADERGLGDRCIDAQLRGRHAIPLSARESESKFRRQRAVAGRTLNRERAAIAAADEPYAVLTGAPAPARDRRGERGLRDDPRDAVLRGGDGRDQRASNDDNLHAAIACLRRRDEMVFGRGAGELVFEREAHRAGDARRRHRG
jgi:hypothetical protein